MALRVFTFWSKYLFKARKTVKTEFPTAMFLAQSPVKSPILWKIPINEKNLLEESSSHYASQLRIK